MHFLPTTTTPFPSNHPFTFHQHTHFQQSSPRLFNSPGSPSTHNHHFHTHFKPFFHTLPEEQLRMSDEIIETTISMEEEKPMKTEEEIEAYFANLVLNPDDYEESSSEEEQETLPSTSTPTKKSTT